MREQAARLFPFAIAVVLPPAGLILGLFTAEQDRDLGIRIAVVSVLAMVVWTLLFLV